jgi:hypothetical protein
MANSYNTGRLNLPLVGITTFGKRTTKADDGKRKFHAQSTPPNAGHSTKCRD